MPKHNTKEELKVLDQRIDKCLEMQLAFTEMYRSNGVESARVAAALEKLEEHSKCRDAKIDEMYTFFNDGRIATKFAKWSFGLLITLGGAFLMIKQIWK